MTDAQVDLDAALERVVTAARAHLTAVRAAEGRPGDGEVDDDVWQAYVELSNASYEYDEMLNMEYGEATPWLVEEIDPDDADEQYGVGLGGIDGDEPTDPHPHVVSVRQRRDYRVPSVAALLRVAEAARRSEPDDDDDPDEPVESVGAAVLQLVKSGDGSLAALDVPELEPMDGIVIVAEVAEALDVDEFGATDGSGPFRFAEHDRVVGRLAEYPPLFDDEDDEEFEDLDVADDQPGGGSGPPQPGGEGPDGVAPVSSRTGLAGAG
ncbi:MAG TPA: hypothetical protein VFM37_08815 [Pseudonocardiaceae bacterium]|nr:hypothetical protein [Pseudonocardiaceae bacterium]